jgi:hypothetical protein
VIAIRKGRNAIHLSQQNGTWATAPLFTATLCGRTVTTADGWGEVFECATCSRCEVVNADIESARDALLWVAYDEAMAEQTTRAARTFTVGQRVGILTGFQSVTGAWVASYGTILRPFEGWHGAEMWTVQGDDGGEPLVYEAWQLRSEVQADAVTGEWPCDCSAYPASHPVHCDGCSARKDECVCSGSEVEEWRNLRGSRVATARRYVRDARALRQAGALPGDVLEALAYASYWRRRGMHASVILATL